MVSLGALTSVLLCVEDFNFNRFLPNNFSRNQYISIGSIQSQIAINKMVICALSMSMSVQYKNRTNQNSMQHLLIKLKHCCQNIIVFVRNEFINKWQIILYLKSINKCVSFFPKTLLASGLENVTIEMVYRVVVSVVLINFLVLG